MQTQTNLNTRACDVWGMSGDTWYVMLEHDSFSFPGAGKRDLIMVFIST